MWSTLPPHTHTPCHVALACRRDQAILNWLEYTGQLSNVSRVIERRGTGIVNTLRYAPPDIRARHLRLNPRLNNSSPTALQLSIEALRWPEEMPFTISNLGADQRLSPVVHQYDADKFLLRLMDRVALAHQNDSSPQQEAGRRLSHQSARTPARERGAYPSSTTQLQNEAAAAILADASGADSVVAGADYRRLAAESVNVARISALSAFKSTFANSAA